MINLYLNINCKRKFHFWSWVISIMCAGFFIAASIGAGDILFLN